MKGLVQGALYSPYHSFPEMAEKHPRNNEENVADEKRNVKKKVDDDILFASEFNVVISDVAGLCGVDKAAVETDVAAICSLEIHIDKTYIDEENLRLLGILAVKFNDEQKQKCLKGTKTFFENFFVNSVYKKMVERLKDLLNVRHDDKIPSTVQPFSSTDWAKSHRSSILNGIVTYIIQRVQYGRHCFLNAPLTMFIYLLLMNSGQQVPTQDLRAFVLCNLDGRDFFDFIDGLGGYSKQVIEMLVGPQADIFTISEKEFSQGIVTKEFLAEHGAVLVSGCKLFPEFCGGSNVDYTGVQYKYMDAIPIDSSIKAENHAMLIVDETDGTYLLQNWWKNAQFLEVSKAFLLSRKCSFHAASSFKGVTSMPKSVSTKLWLYDEASNEGDDGGIVDG